MKNWKTSLSSAILAAGVALAAQDDPIAHITGQIMQVIGSIALGYFAKDSNVTGGTIKQ